jgi:hypothetical protein
MGSFLQKVYPPLKTAAGDVETWPISTPVTHLDKYSARHVLAAVWSDARVGWVDRLRGKVLEP